MRIVQLFAVFLIMLYTVTVVHLLLFPSTLYAVSGIRWIVAICVPYLIAYKARIKKQLTLSGAVSAFCLGFTLLLYNYVIACSMITFFVLSSMLTQFRKKRKMILEKDFVKNAERNWEQVLCNGGVCLVACLLSIMKYGLRSEYPIDLSKRLYYGLYDLAALGCVAGAAGDTWASEVGVALGSTYPRLITTLRLVPAGTNGAVSLIGTLAGLAGGFTTGLAYYGFSWLFCSRNAFDRTSDCHLIVIYMCSLCGLLASAFDSLLGALFQYSGYDTRSKSVVQQSGPHVRHISGRDILSNNSVNLLCTTFSSIAAVYIAAWLADLSTNI